MNARGVAGVAFDTARDFVHHRNRFFGPRACRTFGRKHDRIGTVINCRCNVRHFGAGWCWCSDHRFEHLRRNDDRAAQPACSLDDTFLRRRHGFRRQFDAQIAARNHHRVGKFENIIEPVESGRFFNLGEQCRATFDQAACFGEIFGSLNERQSDPVNPLIKRERQIGAILFGKCGHRHDHIGDVEPLVVG